MGGRTRAVSHQKVGIRLMDLGIPVPNITQPVGRESIVRVAQHADDLGFHSIWLADHIVYPIDRSLPIEVVRQGKYAGDLYEALVTASYVAALTERVKIGFGVLVAPYRNIVLLAKMVTTLDQLSEGRVILGLGPGYLAGEFHALGILQRHTGDQVDDLIDLLRAVAESTEPDFQGRWTSLHDTVFRPPPLQAPLPVWIGGTSEAAMRRAARVGNGWHVPALDVASMAPMMLRFQEVMSEAGRDPSEVTVSNRPRVRLSRRPVLAAERASPTTRYRDSAPHIEGPPEYVADQLRQYGDLGVTHLVLDLHEGDTLVTILRAMERIAGDVAPLLAAGSGSGGDG